MSAAIQNEVERLREERDKAITQRDYLVSEYERAVKCGQQGFAHACGHLYSAISNAKCDANTERFISIQKERNAAIEREAALAAHGEGLKEALEDITQAAQQEGLQFSGWQDQIDNAIAALLSYPSTSLTRRDLIKQAEAYRNAIAAIESSPSNASQMIEGMAIYCERQSQGLST